MQHFLTIFICAFFLIGTSSEIYARHSGGSSFGGSRSSRNSDNKAVVSRKTSGTSQKAAISKPSKAKAQSKSNLTKAVKKKNASANNKYSKYGKDARKQAATDFKKSNEWKNKSQSLAKNNKYNSPTPPSQRPEHIPQNVTVNNTTVNTSYGMLPGGYYGYGYMDPIIGTMVALAAHDMMVTNAMLRNHGYGTYSASGAVVVTRDPIGIILGIIFGLLFLGVIVYIIFHAIKED